MAVNLKALSGYRNLCENHVRREWFQNPQDAHQLETVLQACSDPELWRWITAARREVFSPLEGGRHWGMVCPCHETERHNGEKAIHCIYNSCRPHQAWDFIEKQAQQFSERSAQLDRGETDNDDRTLTKTKSMLNNAVGTLKTRFKYFVPHRTHLLALTRPRVLPSFWNGTDGGPVNSMTLSPCS